MEEHMDGINKKTTNETMITTTNKEIKTSKIKYTVQDLTVMRKCIGTDS